MASDSSDIMSIQIEGLVKSASRLEAVLNFGGASAGIVVLAKLLGGSDFEIWGLKVKLVWTWIPFAALTIAHLYGALLFIRRAYGLFVAGDTSRSKAWEKLTSGGLLWFDGFIARREARKLPLGFVVYRMSLGDPTTWLAHGVALGFFVAIFDWQNANWTMRLATGLAGGVILVVNWLIGTNWAVAASELALSDASQSRYFLWLKGICVR